MKTNPYTTLRPRTRPYVVPKTKPAKGRRPKKTGVQINKVQAQPISDQLQHRRGGI